MTDIIGKPALLDNLPNEYKCFRGVLGWSGVTEHGVGLKRGIWVADHYRVHYSCPDDELPGAIRDRVKPAANADYFTWTPGTELIRWFRLLARHASYKPALAFMEADKWVYESQDGIIISTFRAKPPLGAVEYGFDVQFLVDALTFVLGKNTRAAVSVQLTKQSYGAQHAPAWLLGGFGYGQVACLAPVVERQCAS